MSDFQINQKGAIPQLTTGDRFILQTTGNQTTGVFWNTISGQLSNPSVSIPNIVTGISITGSNSRTGIFNIVTGFGTNLPLNLNTNTLTIETNFTNYLTSGSASGTYYSKNNESGFITSAAAGGVQTINNNSGAITITGSGGITVQQVGTTTRISMVPCIVGSGSPEGVVAGPSGILYIDWYNIQFHFKMTGTSVNGWVP
jgi:hypothetical protein